MTKLAFSLLVSALFLGCSSSDDDATSDPAAQGGAAGSTAAGAGGSTAGSGGSAAGSGGSKAGSGGTTAGAGGTTAGAGGSTAGSGGQAAGAGGSDAGAGGTTAGSGGSDAGAGGSAAGEGGAAGAGGMPLPGNVPDALKVPDAADVVILKAHGVGVQIYTCTDTAGSGGAGGGGGAGGAGGAEFQWVFKEPKADLFDEAQAKIGIHYVGPTWESTDGSKVVGMVLAKASAPSASDIAWLLLQAKSTSGTGVLSKVAYIQRLDTQGGVAPADGCDAAAVGQTTEINYEANYYFYAPGP
jgi:hypothetical protein